MKPYLATIVFVGLFMYLIGSFAAATFALPKWSETLRSVVAFVYFMLCLLFVPMALPETKRGNKQ